MRKTSKHLQAVISTIDLIETYVRMTQAELEAEFLRLVGRPATFTDKTAMALVIVRTVAIAHENC